MPIVLQLQATELKPRRGNEHFWKMARELASAHGEFTVNDIFERSDERYIKTVQGFVRRLVRDGFAEKIGVRRANGRKLNLYRLVKMPEQAPVLSASGQPGTQGLAQQQMWNIIRGPQARQGFTWRDLILLASTDKVAVKEHVAKSYVNELVKAGYFQVLRPAKPGAPAVLRLKPSCDTGLKAPKILRAKIVWDANAGKAMGDLIATEEDVA